MKKSDIVSRFRSEMYQELRRNDPYTGLYESSALVGIWFGQQIANSYEDALPIVSNEKFGKFDFVVFTETNDIFSFTDEETSSEVVIFNPALQRAHAMDDRKQ